MSGRGRTVRALGRVTAMTTLLCAAAGLVPAPVHTEAPLDRLLAAYVTGDRDIVTETFARSQDFRTFQLADPERLEKWLGAWRRDKAVLLLEVAEAATRIAPSYTLPVILAGQRYIIGSADAAHSVDGAFTRTWHHTAVGLMQRNSLTNGAEQYLEVLEKSSKPGSNGDAVPGRLALARGIAQDQRCWSDRPALQQAGTTIDDVMRAAGRGAAVRGGPPRRVVARQSNLYAACLREALRRYEAASESSDVQAEAIVRGAWVRFQLGETEAAFRTLGSVQPGADRELAYWASLFLGRIADVLGRDRDAERAYRAALLAAPDAQTAAIGLTLALFRMNRSEEAEAMGMAVRTRSAAAVDPWWIYHGGDQRFVARWIGELRAASQ